MPLFSQILKCGKNCTNRMQSNSRIQTKNVEVYVVESEIYSNYLKSYRILGYLNNYVPIS